jgi:hypothetical protein
MKNQQHLHVPMTRLSLKHLILSIAVFFGLLTAPLQAAPLSDGDKQFLTGYEKVRGALAADDLSSAKTAAADLGANGTDLAKADSLKNARSAFEKLSDKARELAAGQSGYYVVHCPMLKKDWIQATEKIGNPYYGKEMATCGEIKK